MFNKRIITPLLIILLLISIVAFGTPTYVNVGPTTEFDGDIKILSEIVAEGTVTDEFETTIFITNPTADRTITIPDSNQTLDLSLYYLKTAIDTKAEMDTIWGVTITTTADSLSAFAATTSAELAGVISDETGSSKLVYNIEPILVKPAINDSNGNEILRFDEVVDAVNYFNMTNNKIVTITAVSFTGSGLDDATSGGTYTGKNTNSYKVEIDGTGTPNTFKWSYDGGSTWNNSTVAITGAAQTLNNGITITFGATTGHTATDYWTFTATPNSILVESAGSDTNIDLQLKAKGTGTIYANSDIFTDRWLLNESNTFIGIGVAGLGNLANTTGNEGYRNVGIGYHVFEDITKGLSNVAIGYRTAENITIGENNIAIGAWALNNATTGNDNMSIGMYNLYDCTGNQNVAVGTQALREGANINYNTAIGYRAGYKNTGNSSLFLGWEAGYNEVNSNRLYIETSTSATPLIYGEFDNDVLKFNGDVYVEKALMQKVVTIADGDATPDITAGNIFITSSNTGATEITDLDNPTVGQIITLIGGSDTNASTIADAGNFKLSAAMTLGLDDNITLFVKTDNNYIELSRSVN